MHVKIIISERFAKLMQQRSAIYRNEWDKYSIIEMFCKQANWEFLYKTIKWKLCICLQYAKSKYWFSLKISQKNWFALGSCLKTPNNYLAVNPTFSMTMFWREVMSFKNVHTHIYRLQFVNLWHVNFPFVCVLAFSSFIPHSTYMHHISLH
jgi:hypothetical protein